MAIIFSNKEVYPHADIMLLNKVHNRLFDKLFKDFDYTQAKANSNKITKYFQDIKDYMNKKQHNPEEPFANTLGYILNEALKPISTNLFNFGHMLPFQAGDKFEKTLEIICNTAIEKLNERGVITTNITATKVGNTQTAPGIKFNVDDEIIEIKKVFKNELGAKMKSETGDEFFQFIEKQQKTDVDISKGDLLYLIDINPKDKLLQFVKLINGKSFSAKNYTNITKVDLFTTKPFRAYMSTLAFIDDNNTIGKEKEYLKIYFSAQESIKHNNTKTKEHDIHIRFTYDLLGTGQQYLDTRTMAKMPDYFIVNERFGKRIEVFDTKMLLYEEINQYKNRVQLDFKYSSQGKLVFNSTII